MTKAWLIISTAVSLSHEQNNGQHCRRGSWNFCDKGEVVSLLKLVPKYAKSLTQLRQYPKRLIETEARVSLKKNLPGPFSSATVINHKEKYAPRLAETTSKLFFD